MAGKFARPQIPEFKPQQQQEILPTFDWTQRNNTEPTPSIEISLASELVQSYGNTISFMEWIESLLDNEMKDVVVEINPEEQPEVWMAMNRIFNNPNPKITYSSYRQVVEMLEQAEELDANDTDPMLEEDKFIQQLQSIKTESLDTNITDTTVDQVNIDELVELTRIRTFGPGGQTIAADNEPNIRPVLKALSDKMKWYKLYLNTIAINPIHSDSWTLQAAAARQNIITIKDLIIRIHSGDEIPQEQIDAILK